MSLTDRYGGERRRMKHYWHKPSGVAISEASMLALVEDGFYDRIDFEEARQFGPSRSLLDPPGTVARLPGTTGRRETQYGAPPDAPVLQTCSAAGKARRLR